MVVRINNVPLFVYNRMSARDNLGPEGEARFLLNAETWCRRDAAILIEEGCWYLDPSQQAAYEQMRRVIRAVKEEKEEEE